MPAVPSSLPPSPLLPWPRRRGVLLVAALTLLAACQDPTRVSAADRRAIADSLSTLVTRAYDFSQPGAAERLLSLYPDSGRVISAVAGQVTTRRDTLEGAIRGFWQRVGQNMQQPRFVLGSTYVDVLTRDAAVMTLTYSIPHRTPRDTPHVVSGAWTMLWRRQGGRWQIVQEHLSDTPESTAPGPPPAVGDSTDGSHTEHQH
jgi:ketosteroid isomerase-like protein